MLHTFGIYSINSVPGLFQLGSSTDTVVQHCNIIFAATGPGWRRVRQLPCIIKRKRAVPNDRFQTTVSSLELSFYLPLTLFSSHLQCVGVLFRFTTYRGEI